MYTLVFLVCEHYFTRYYNIEKATGVVYTIILTSHLTMYYFSERNSISLWRYLLHRNGWFFICKILQKLHLDYPPCMYVVNAKKYICIRICPEKRCLKMFFFCKVWFFLELLLKFFLLCIEKNLLWSNAKSPREFFRSYVLLM